MASDDLKRVKSEVLTALSHEEAEEGLYFSNLFHLHEEDEREPVKAEPQAIIDALESLVAEGKVTMEGAGAQAVFRAVKRA